MSNNQTTRVTGSDKSILIIPFNFFIFTVQQSKLNHILEWNFHVINGDILFIVETTWKQRAYNKMTKVTNVD